MRLNLASVATAVALIQFALGEKADYPEYHHGGNLDWTPPCDDPRTITKTYTVYAIPETVKVVATRTAYRTTTGDGIVRYTRTTSVATSDVSTTVTRTITSFKTVATSTRTITRTSTVRRPDGFIPAADTVYGYPDWDDKYSGWHGQREAAQVEVAEGEKAAKAERSEHAGWPEHHECHDHYGADGIYTVEKLVTVTPSCVTRTYYKTVTKPYTYIPTTISVTSRFSRTTTVISRSTRSTTVTSPTTVTRTKTVTTDYYAACATNNIILTGPKGHTITNVFNNGPNSPSTYDVAEGSYETPYDCCVACQKSSTCEGSVFRTGRNFCLLLRRKDRQCGPQCENRAQYTTDPDSREAGLVLSNGQCGYLSWSGPANAGIPVYTGNNMAKARGPGL